MKLSYNMILWMPIIKQNFANFLVEKYPYLILYIYIYKLNTYNFLWYLELWWMDWYGFLQNILEVLINRLKGS